MILESGFINKIITGTVVGTSTVVVTSSEIITAVGLEGLSMFGFTLGALTKILLAVSLLVLISLNLVTLFYKVKNGG